MSAHDHAVTHGTQAAHPVHRNYVKIWGILVVLLVISVAGPFLGIRVITLITAFGIALVKAYMVAKNFMHLDVEKPIIHWLLAVILVLMVLLFAGVAPDVMKDTGRHWKKDAGFHTLPSSGQAGEGEHGHGAENH
jgi:caa(3)-type oxidase subunit IV